MSRPTYSLTFHQNGVKRFAVTVLAQPAYAIGDYHLGQAYEPPSALVREVLPFAYRKAFDRAVKWWREKGSSRVMPSKCYLVSLKGKPLGTLYATPNFFDNQIFD